VELDGENILVVKDLRKKFDGLEVLRGVTLRVPRTRIVGLIGPNGSGKTTLINVISGVLKPDGGEIWFNHSRAGWIRINGLNPHQVARLGISRSFQIPRLFSSLRVVENVAISIEGRQGLTRCDDSCRNAWSKAVGLLEHFGMSNYMYSPVSELSVAHSKLVEVLRGLAVGAQLYLLDEPAAGLDPLAAENVFKAIVETRNLSGSSFLVVEHRLEVLLKYVDYVYVLHEGRVIAEGPPGDIVENAAVREVYIGGNSKDLQP